MTTRPNVLLICTDQQRWNSLGCTGNPFARTPHLDALAENNCLHKRFFACNTVCMPSRASLLTGLYPSSHGVWSNGVPLQRRDHIVAAHNVDLEPAHMYTLADYFAAADYHTGAVGKLHLTPTRTDAALGYREAYALWDSGHNDDWHGPYYGFQHVSMTSGHGDEGAISGRGHYGLWLHANHPELAQACADAQNQAPRPIPELHDCYPSPMTVAQHPSSWIASECVDFIKQTNENGKPWFLWAGFPDPHHPFTPPQELWDLFDDKACVDPCDQAGDLLACTPDLPQHTNRIADIDIEAQRHFIRATNAMNHLIDRAVGTMIEALVEAGQWENTIIIFTADHGEYLGDHGLLRKMVTGFDNFYKSPASSVHR